MNDVLTSRRFGPHSGRQATGQRRGSTGRGDSHGHVPQRPPAARRAAGPAHRAQRSDPRAGPGGRQQRATSTQPGQSQGFSPLASGRQVAVPAKPTNQLLGRRFYFWHFPTIYTSGEHAIPLHVKICSDKSQKIVEHMGFKIYIRVLS